MRQTQNTESSTPCRRCHRRLQLSHKERLCDRCEQEFNTRRSELPLSTWKILGFLLVVPLVALTWNTKSPLGDALPGVVLGHAWLILLGVFAGEYLSKRLAKARVLLFRHRFEKEDLTPTSPPKGLYEV